MPTINKKTRSIGPDVDRQRRQKVYQSKQWKQLRAAHLAAHPLCEACLAAGMSVLAVDVHHLRSFTRQDRSASTAAAYDSRNLCSLCKRCHTSIHHGLLKGCSSIAEIRDRVQKLSNHN